MTKKEGLTIEEALILRNFEAWRNSEDMFFDAMKAIAEKAQKELGEQTAAIEQAFAWMCNSVGAFNEHNAKTSPIMQAQWVEALSAWQAEGEPQHSESHTRVLRAQYWLALYDLWLERELTGLHERFADRLAPICYCSTCLGSGYLGSYRNECPKCKGDGKRR